VVVSVSLDHTIVVTPVIGNVRGECEAPLSSCLMGTRLSSTQIIDRSCWQLC
jgi:hypothetical protein